MSREKELKELRIELANEGVLIRSLFLTFYFRGSCGGNKE